MSCATEDTYQVAGPYSRGVHFAAFQVVYAHESVARAPKARRSVSQAQDSKRRRQAETVGEVSGTATVLG